MQRQLKKNAKVYLTYSRLDLIHKPKHAAKLQKIFNINKLNLKIMYSLQVIKETLSEKQFTQLAVNNVNDTFVVCVYFRHINIFECKEYDTYSKAYQLYKKMTED